MKKILITLLCTPLLIVFFAPQSHAGIDFGISIDKNGISEFHLAISNHYKVEEKEIITVSKKRISNEELPIVFFLAKKAGVKSSVIIQMRLNGNSWQEVADRFKLKPDIFFIDLKSNPGPPYGKAYGHYKNKSKNKREQIRLTDDDIVNFVNLKFITGHYGYDPATVIEMRSKGRGFVEINQTVKQQKNEKSKQAKADKKSSKGKSKNKKK